MSIRKFKALFSAEKSSPKAIQIIESNFSDDTTLQAPCITNPQELGRVEFLRDLDEACKISSKYSKPIFALFQEIPGCITCQRFGSNVLTQPLMVELIQNEFVPLAINNRCVIGHDAKVCKSFNEPSYNNPVVRFFNSHQQDIIPRADGIFDAKTILERIRLTLIREQRSVPLYLNLLHLQLREQQYALQIATFTMNCYWQGEKIFGALDGVASTQPGWINATEVVRVTFDAIKIPFKILLQHAKAAGFGVLPMNSTQTSLASATSIQSGVLRKIHVFTDVRASERKYYLKKTLLRYLPLLSVQAARLNAIAASNSMIQMNDEALRQWLSPQQAHMLKILVSLDKQHIAKLAIAPEEFKKLIAHHRIIVSSLQ